MRKTLLVALAFTALGLRPGTAVERQEPAPSADRWIQRAAMDNRTSMRAVAEVVLAEPTEDSEASVDGAGSGASIGPADGAAGGAADGAADGPPATSG